MHGNEGSADPQNTTGPSKAFHQLTVGELLMLDRMSALVEDMPGSLSLDYLVHIIVSINVCATCGWTEQIHTGHITNKAYAHHCGTYAPSWTQDERQAWGEKG